MTSRGSKAQGWIRIDEQRELVLVFCNLCGQKATKFIVHVSDVADGAERMRRAAAHAVAHRDGEMHAAATTAFHAEIGELTRTEDAWVGAFGGTEMDVRRARGAVAAKQFQEASSEGSDRDA